MAVAEHCAQVCAVLRLAVDVDLVRKSLGHGVDQSGVDHDVLEVRAKAFQDLDHGLIVPPGPGTSLLPRG